MNIPKLFSDSVWRDDLVAITKTPELWLYAVLVVLAPSITFVSLRALGSIVPGACVILSILFLWQYRRLPLPSFGLASIWAAFMALIVYASLIALDADYAWGRVGKLAMFSFSAMMIWICAQQGHVLRPLKTVMVGIMGIAILFGLMEGLTDGWFFWLTHDVDRLGAVLAANRPMVVLALMIWPVVLILAERVGVLAVAGLLLGILLVSFTAESQSSQLGLFAGSVVLSLALVWPRATGWACLVGGAVAILGMPFFFAFIDLNQAIGESALARNTILPRLELWAFVGEKVIDLFPFGYGLEAGRSISLADMDQTYFQGSLMHHPHNGVLQIWLEFGLIGAVGAALAWMALIKRVIEMNRWPAATSLAGAGCFLVIASVSHGLWQSWWVSALALVPFLFAVANVPEKR
ncbi:MAG: O-antigen ligase family protein [Parvibaculaceae bacterium]|nr:O-antigen ligase family protein [Parvibaculaceae bacterium]